MSELRKDPIIGRWVIISTERAKRPSDLTIEPNKSRGGFCPLCPGNEDKTPPEVFAVRDGVSHPDTSGWRLRVVPNKFPALAATGGIDKRTEGFYEYMAGFGVHEVVIETTEHNASAATLQVEDFKLILLTYKKRIGELKNDGRFQYVSVFKNYGEVAGSTLEHPHSQIIALPVVPKRSVEEIQGAQQHHARTGQCVFCDIIKQELTDGRRVVFENEMFVALAPYASRFPFEISIVPKKHIACFEDSDDHMLGGLAEGLSVVLKVIHRALGDPPYNYMLHSASLDQDVHEYYHWHLEIIPRLTRVAGFEWGSGFYINPTPPEQAAQHLRETLAELQL